ncbi:MAG: hypothetical protein PHF10_01470 [Patescibacteria group bacterium]|nr:hypothetical protein [Patescibacteria group bacterium]MDD5534402.1 hypothetical protein [Patescibacteria group bacterium]
MNTSQKAKGVWNMTKGAFEESIRMLEADIFLQGGDPCKIFDRLRTDKSFTRQIARLMINGGFEPTTSQKRALEIMGDENFFGVDEAIKHFGVDPSRQQCAIFSGVPFSEAILKECRKTHILVAIFPLSIMEIETRHPELFDTDILANAKNQPFLIKNFCRTGWHLIRKTPIESSFSKNWQEQQILLRGDEEIPTAQAMVYTIIGYFMANNQHLFERILIRTSSTDRYKSRVHIGTEGNGKLMVVCYGDKGEDNRYDHTGITTAIQPKNP